MELKNKISENNKKAAEIAMRIAQSTTEKSFSDKLKWLDNEINKLSKMKEVKAPADMGKFSANINAINARIVDLSKHLSGLEERITPMERNVKEVQQPNLDSQIEELVNKIVFLETRLGAMENVMSKNQNIEKIQPIILE
jgi:chromosome segregation ATPase